jgi:hypothetical protein
MNLFKKMAVVIFTNSRGNNTSQILLKLESKNISSKVFYLAQSVVFLAQ